ncbi:putative phosphoribosyl transferase domain protein [Bifidobacterium saguini DSM 23967]|uniref:ComF family protein n=2 Tax=Bifidobacterium saguini TaxID=762210 RepID=A0ABX7SD11_9BIFI|nr:putative phosphoribosyl transferase domain protein [Bifidobacterium saguini DSM 23967]QTB91232.1 ComF family protein [Bifidobacterium saguini]
MPRARASRATLHCDAPRSTPVHTALSSVARAAFNVLLPRGCAGCDAPDDILCADCLGLFAQCRLRDLEVESATAGAGLPVWSAAIYQGVARHAILEWKDHDDVELDAVFSQIMEALTLRCGIVQRCAAAGCTSVLVVPAPSSRASMRRRGRWHTLPLAQAVVNALQSQSIAAMMTQALESRASGGRSVQQISSAQRAQRIGGNIHVTAPSAYRGAAVVLVDDIVTTGSTLRQCAQALRQSGAQVLGALALADVAGQHSNMLQSAEI